QKLHQGVDLLSRSRPVRHAERVQRQAADTLFSTRAHGFAHGSGSLGVTGRAQKAAGLSPAPVAVHDDCNVLGNPTTVAVTVVQRIIPLSKAPWAGVNAGRIQDARALR